MLIPLTGIHTCTACCISQSCIIVNLMCVIVFPFSTYVSFKNVKIDSAHHGLFISLIWWIKTTFLKYKNINAVLNKFEIRYTADICQMK